MNALTSPLQQLFDRAFQKAILGGWSPEDTEITAIEFNGIGVPITGVLFNRLFMMGLFGTGMVNEKGSKATESNREKIHIWQPAWKYHAKGMIVSDDPIEYLESYFNEQSPV